MTTLAWGLAFMAVYAFLLVFVVNLSHDTRYEAIQEHNGVITRAQPVANRKDREALAHVEIARFPRTSNVARPKALGISDTSVVARPTSTTSTTMTTSTTTATNSSSTTVTTTATTTTTTTANTTTTLTTTTTTTTATTTTTTQRKITATTTITTTTTTTTSRSTVMKLGEERNSSSTRTLLERSKYEIQASHSPLMVAAGLETYQTIPPKTCLSLHIASAYISLHPVNSSIIIVEMAVQSSVKFARHITDHQVSCVIYDKISQVVMVAKTVFSKSSYRVLRCQFDQERNTFIGANLDHKLLPNEAYLLFTVNLDRFQRHLTDFHTRFDRSALASLACSVQLRQIRKLAKPHMFLVGLTEVRSAADRLRDWLTFHLREYDHIVIYDDNSHDNILDVVYPFQEVGLVTYLNWTHVARFPATAPARQFLAMQDFMLRFGSQTEIVSQFDDDFFIYVPEGNIDANGDTPSLREAIQFNLVKFPHISQFHFMAKWFGACNGSSISAQDNSYVLESSLRQYPIYEKLVWRYDKIEWVIPWVKANRPKQLLTIISFTRSVKITSSRMSHLWFVDGPSLVIPNSCIVYNHYKVFAWEDHQEKNRHTWIGSIANRKEHIAMNKLLCKVEDHFLSNQTEALQTWGAQPLQEMAKSVRARPWPIAPVSLEKCSLFRRSSSKKAKKRKPTTTVNNNNKKNGARMHIGGIPSEEEAAGEENEQAQSKSNDNQLANGADAIDIGGVDEEAQPEMMDSEQENIQLINQFAGQEERDEQLNLITLERNFSVSDSPLFIHANLTEHIQVDTEPIFINGITILMGYSSFNSRTGVDVSIILTAARPKKMIELGKHWMCVHVVSETQTFLESKITAWTFRATCLLEWDPSIRRFELLPTSVFLVQRSKFSLFKQTYLQVKDGIIDHKLAIGNWACVTLQRFVRPASPSIFLMGLTEVRDASVRLRDWLLYAFRIGYDHLVIYDDYSNDDILEILHPFYRAGLVTYIRWSVPKSSLILYEHRQLLAMEHFALVFAAQAELINQFDDDCFFTSQSISLASAPTLGTDTGTLRPLLKHLLAKYPSAGQFQARGKWFGACDVDHENGTSVRKVLQTSIVGSPVYEKLVWRYSPAQWTIPWFKKGLAPNILVALSFTRSSKILANMHLTHWWRVDGKNIQLSEACLAYNHYKMLPWEDHQEKNKHTWLGSQANATEHTFINNHLCKVKDTSISQWSPQLREWNAMSTEYIATLVKTRPFPPVTTQKFTFC